MSAPQAERRIHKRIPMMGHLPAKLKTDAGTEITFIPVDISKQGAGFVLNSMPPRHSIVTLHFENELKCSNGKSIKDLQLKIVWGLEKISQLHLFRVGCVCVDPDLDLIELFNQVESVFIDEK